MGKTTDEPRYINRIEPLYKAPGKWPGGLYNGLTKTIKRRELTMATDWIFYEEMARDMIRDAFIYDTAAKDIKPADIKRFAKDRNITAKTLAVAFENVKYKFDPKDDFE